MTVYMVASPKSISRRNFKRYLAEHLRLPRTVKRVEEEAFLRQEKIKSVTFPDGLTSIGAGAFQGCIHLKELVIPDSLLFMEKEVFSGCRDLSSVRLSSALNNIPDRAFYKCRKLTQIDFPEGLQKIGAEAFYFAGISELRIPSTVTTIKDRAFFRCSQLTSVKLPSNVARIGSEVFHGCNQLKTLEIAYDPIYIGERIVNRSTKIRCYEGSTVDAYCKKNEIPTEYIVDKHS